jgi:hypothetical protein
MSEVVIGLSGGEDEVRWWIAQHLEQRHGYLTFGLRMPARLAAVGMLNADPRLVGALPEARRKPIDGLGKSIAEIEQMLTRWGRERLSPRLWTMVASESVKAVRQQCEAAGQPIAGMVWVDVGSVEEADWIRTEQQGHMIHVREPGKPLDAWYQPGDRQLEDHLSAEDMERQVEETLPWLAPARRLIVATNQAVNH